MGPFIDVFVVFSSTFVSIFSTSGVHLHSLSFFSFSLARIFTIRSDPTPSSFVRLCLSPHPHAHPRSFISFARLVLLSYHERLRCTSTHPRAYHQHQHRRHHHLCIPDLSHQLSISLLFPCHFLFLHTFLNNTVLPATFPHIYHVLVLTPVQSSQILRNAHTFAHFYLLLWALPCSSLCQPAFHLGPVSERRGGAFPASSKHEVRPCPGLLFVRRMTVSNKDNDLIGFGNLQIVIFNARHRLRASPARFQMRVCLLSFVSLIPKLLD